MRKKFFVTVRCGGCGGFDVSWVLRKPKKLLYTGFYCLMKYRCEKCGKEWVEIPLDIINAANDTG